MNEFEAEWRWMLRILERSEVEVPYDKAEEWIRLARRKVLSERPALALAVASDEIGAGSDDEKELEVGVAYRAAALYATRPGAQNGYMYKLKVGDGEETYKVTPASVLAAGWVDEGNAAIERIGVVAEAVAAGGADNPADFDVASPTRSQAERDGAGSAFYEMFGGDFRPGAGEAFGHWAGDDD